MFSNILFIPSKYIQLSHNSTWVIVINSGHILSILADKITGVRLGKCARKEEDIERRKEKIKDDYL